ncbi:hypothetical protein K9M47_01305 [Candidatus Gracilibacteria bacterium]|nr:hypothetical protein [Candidatus Gracilibacteria bacterium]MCF7898605.1 hypothetical protein [Candidatus Paceibacterota bacterium]
MKRNRGRRGRIIKPIPSTPIYRNPLTGTYAFPASFAENFAENVKQRFAKK